MTIKDWKRYTAPERQQIARVLANLHQFAPQDARRLRRENRQSWRAPPGTYTVVCGDDRSEIYRAPQH